MEGECAAECGERKSAELAQDLWTKNNSCRVVQPSGLPARVPASLRAWLYFLPWN